MGKTVKNITVIIPCRNEAKGIGDVIRGFKIANSKRSGYKIHVIIVDNNSTDGTALVAREHGATVVHEPARGKGNALRTAFRSIPMNADYVVMIDGDNTYKSEEVFRLIEPIESNFCNVVIGSRLTGKIEKHAMGGVNRVGNWMFSFLVRHFYGVNTTDVLTGYIAWNHCTLMRLSPHLNAKGFGIEMDMITKMAKLRESVYSVPITYAPRSGQTNLRPFLDGFLILYVFLANFFWRPEGFSIFKYPRFLRRAGYSVSV